MNFYAISALINLITSLILGIFAFSKNPKKPKNISFFLLTISIAFWSLFYFLWQICDNYESALFLTRVLSVGSTFIPIFYLQWVLLMLDLFKDKKRLAILFFGYLITVFFLFFSFSNLFVKDVVPELGFDFWPKPGPIYTSYLILSYIGLIGYALFELIKGYCQKQGIIRYQIKYIILATVISFVGGATNFFLWYGIPILPIGNILVALYTIILFYAMVKYRLMDIRIVVRKFVIFIGASGVVYGAYYLVTWFYNKFFGGIYTNGSYLTGLIVAPFFVAIFSFLTKYIKKFANKYLFFSLYNYQEAINKLAGELNKSIDLNNIVDSIVGTIKKTMQLNRAGILLVEESERGVRYKIVKVIGFNEKNGISLVQDSFLTEYLRKTKKPLVREELFLLAKDFKNQKERKNFLELESNMKRIEASLCLPLVSNNNLIGIIVLGSKISGDAYTKEDLDLLSALSFQAGIAIDNARLYKEIRDFNKTLQQKVDEQTKEIRHAYEVEKKARESLEKTNEAKTQFIMATQHHLRTPLTSMHGYLDLLLKGGYGKIPKKIKKIIEKFKISTENEIRVVNDLLDISQFQLGRQVVSLKDGVYVQEIIKQAVEDVKLEAEGKGIFLKTEILDDIPSIKADFSKLKVALYNIIDNAVKYTQKGGVIISLKVKSFKKIILIRIKDTGVGIPKENQKELFNKLFERGEGAMKMFATGKGIGLWIAFKIIESHKGKIWAESEGTGKGSVFFVELPI